jgi:drug/metabolite transporter (DMT)-like permease
VKNPKTLPLAAIIITAVIWGLSFLSIKISVAVLPPMTLALSRFIIASFLLYLSLKYYQPDVKLEIKDYPLMMIAGVIGVTLYFYFENTGVKLTNAAIASLIMGTIPVFTVIAEAVVFRNKLNNKITIGVLLSLLGVYFIVGVQLSDASTGFWLGNLMMLGAAVSWVVYSLATKPLYKKYSQLAIVTYQTLFGTVALIPFSLLEDTPWHLVSWEIVFNVVFLGVFCSALGYFLYIYAMDHLGISVTSFYINLIPVVTVTASYFILGEKITTIQFVGGLLIIISVYLVSWQGKNDKT